MSDMVYDAHLEDLYKKYAALPEMEKRAVETLSVLFGGFYKYVKLRNLSALMGYKLTNPELTDLLSLSRKARGRFVELKKDQFLALTADLKKQLEELDAFVSLDKGRVQVHRFAAHALDEMKEQVASFKADKSWRDFRKQVALAGEEDLPVPAALKAELRPYQVERSEERRVGKECRSRWARDQSQRK